MMLMLVACGLDSPQEKKGKDTAPTAATAPETATAPVPETAKASETETAKPTVAPTVAVAATVAEPKQYPTLAIRIANGEFDGPLGIKKLNRERIYSDETESELTHVDQMGRVPLHYAKDPALVAYLWNLTYGTHSQAAYTVPDKNHQIPLHVFADEGFTAGVQVYLDKFCHTFWEAAFGTTLNAIDSANRTALHLVVITGQKETAAALLKCSTVNLEPQDTSGRTPMHYAVELEDFAIAESILITSDERRQPLHLLQKDKKEKTAIDLAHGYDKAVLEAAALGHKLPR